MTIAAIIRQILFALAAAALLATAVLATAPARAADNAFDKALVEALAKDEKEFRAAMKTAPRSNVIGAVAKGPHGYYVTSLHPGESLHSTDRKALQRIAEATLLEGLTTQGGQ